ncbi:MAG: PaaI family thioesterase [Hymenobacter sp.]
MPAATPRNRCPPRSPYPRKAQRQYFMHLIGADLTRIEPGRVEAELALGQQHQQQRGFAHGGLVATMADLAAGFAGRHARARRG